MYTKVCEDILCFLLSLEAGGGALCAMPPKIQAIGLKNFTPPPYGHLP